MLFDTFEAQADQFKVPSFQWVKPLITETGDWEAGGMVTLGRILLEQVRRLNRVFILRSSFKITYFYWV